MNFFKKVIQFFRGLFSKNSSEVPDQKNLDSLIESDISRFFKFKVLVIKIFKLIYKYLKKFVVYIFGLIHTMMQPMIRISKKHPIAFWVAVTLHAIILFALLYANVERWEPTDRSSAVAEAAPIQAVMIDMEIIEAEQDLSLINI